MVSIKKAADNVGSHCPDWGPIYLAAMIPVRIPVVVPAKVPVTARPVCPGTADPDIIPVTVSPVTRGPDVTFAWTGRNRFDHRHRNNRSRHQHGYWNHNRRQPERHTEAHSRIR